MKSTTYDGTRAFFPVLELPKAKSVKNSDKSAACDGSVGQIPPSFCDRDHKKHVRASQFGLNVDFNSFLCPISRGKV